LVKLLQLRRGRRIVQQGGFVEALHKRSLPLEDVEQSSPEDDKAGDGSANEDPKKWKRKSRKRQKTVGPKKTYESNAVVDDEEDDTNAPTGE
jgi:hypothetical protein